MLDVPDSLAGCKETCPSCRHENYVPCSIQFLRPEDISEQAELVPQKQIKQLRSTQIEILQSMADGQTIRLDDDGRWRLGKRNITPIALGDLQRFNLVKKANPKKSAGVNQNDLVITDRGREVLQDNLDLQARREAESLANSMRDRRVNTIPTIIRLGHGETIRDYVENHGLEIDENASDDDAERLFRYYERVKHYICGLWHHIAGESATRTVGGDRFVKLAAACIVNQDWELAVRTYNVVVTGGFADQFLQDDEELVDCMVDFVVGEFERNFGQKFPWSPPMAIRYM